MNKYTTILLYSLVVAITVLASDAFQAKANFLKVEKDNFDSLVEFNTKFANVVGYQLNSPKYVNQKCDVLKHLVESAEVTASLTQESKDELLKGLKDASDKFEGFQGKRQTFLTEVDLLVEQLNRSKDALNKAETAYQKAEDKEVANEEFAAVLSKETAAQQSVAFHLYEIALSRLFSNYDELAQTVETSSLRFNFLYQNLSKLHKEGESHDLNDALFKQVTLNGRYLFTLLKRLDLYLYLTGYFKEQSAKLNKSVNKVDSMGNTFVDELKKNARDAAEYNEYVYKALTPRLLEVHGLLLSAQTHNDSSLLTLSRSVVDRDDYYEVFKAFKVSTENLVSALAELKSSGSTQFFALVFDNFDKLLTIKEKVDDIEKFRLEQLNFEQEEQRKAELKKESELVNKQEEDRQEKLEKTANPEKKDKRRNVKQPSYNWIYFTVGGVLALLLAIGVVVFKVWRELRHRGSDHDDLLSSA